MKNAETLRVLEKNVCDALLADPGARLREFARGERLYDQGQVASLFYAIISGRVQVSMARPDGYELILEIMGPGVVLGEGAALDGLPRFSSAAAIEPVQAIEFRSQDLPAAFQRNPDLATSFLWVTAYKQRQLASRLLALTMASPSARIAEMMLRLSNIYGVPTAEGMLITTRLTHEQIAALVGVTRVTVTRALKELTADGVIKMNEDSITVLDPVALHRIGGL